MDFVERAVGGLLGHAIGDAIGFPYEGTPREVMKARPVTDMPEEVVLSDDTAMVVCTAKSLCERGIDVEDLANRFVGWIRAGDCTPEGRAIGVGRTTYEAIGRLAMGVPPQEAGGKGERDNGNGSLMRMLPLVLYLYGGPRDEVLEVVRLYSAVTHAHVRSVIACQFYVLFGMGLYGGATLEGAYLMATETIMGVWRGERELEHYARILEGTVPSLSEEDIISSGYVVHTLEAVLWSLFHGRGFRGSVLKAVNLGGDTDTVGALVGGLAGIHYGSGDIPETWIGRLPMVAELKGLARCLAGTHA